MATRQGGAPPYRSHSNSTFQYAAFRNFDQLSSRSVGTAYSGFHCGLTGGFRSFMAAWAGVRSALRLLQAMHARTQFAHVDVPP